MFYIFRQNNSFGTFTVNNDVTYNVVIEAENEEQALDKAVDLGMYFDGCEKGIDCPCCGDRWDKYPEEVDADYSVREEPHWRALEDEPSFYIYLLDGTKLTQ